MKRFTNDNEKEHLYKETKKKRKKDNFDSLKIEEVLNLVDTTIQINEQINMTNEIKSIIFLIMIKLKTLELQIDVMLDTRASKNLLFETLLSRKKQQTLTQSVELIQYYQ